MYCKPNEYRPAKRVVVKMRKSRRIYNKKNDAVKEVLKAKIPPSAEKIDIIINTICEHFKVRLCDLKTDYRGGEIKEIRKFMYYFIKRYEPNASLEHIGGLFNRHHSTVIAALRSFHDLVDTEYIYSLNKNSINQRLKDIKEPTKNSTLVN